MKAKLLDDLLNPLTASTSNHYDSDFNDIIYFPDLNFSQTYYEDKHFIEFYFLCNVYKSHSKLAQRDLHNQQRQMNYDHGSLHKEQPRIYQYSGYNIINLDLFKKKTAYLKLPNETEFLKPLDKSELKNFYEFLTDETVRSSPPPNIVIAFNKRDFYFFERDYFFNYVNNVTDSIDSDTETDTLSSSENSVSTFNDSIISP